MTLFKESSEEIGMCLGYILIPPTLVWKLCDESSCKIVRVKKIVRSLSAFGIQNELSFAERFCLGPLQVCWRWYNGVTFIFAQSQIKSVSRSGGGPLKQIRFISWERNVQMLVVHGDWRKGTRFPNEIRAASLRTLLFITSERATLVRILWICLSFTLASRPSAFQPSLLDRG